MGIPQVTSPIFAVCLREKHRVCVYVRERDRESVNESLSLGAICKHTTDLYSKFKLI